MWFGEVRGLALENLETSSCFDQDETEEPSEVQWLSITQLVDWGYWGSPSGGRSQDECDLSVYSMTFEKIVVKFIHF